MHYDALVLLYNSIFIPHLNYCSEIWANTYQTNLIKLTVLQKRVIRIIHKVDRYYPTSSLLQNMHILKFADIVKYKSMLIMHQAYHNSLPKNYNCILKSIVKTRSMLQGQKTSLELNTLEQVLDQNCYRFQDQRYGINCQSL